MELVGRCCEPSKRSLIARRCAHVAWDRPVAVEHKLYINACGNRIALTSCTAHAVTDSQLTGLQVSRLGVSPNFRSSHWADDGSGQQDAAEVRAYLS